MDWSIVVPFIVALCSGSLLLGAAALLAVRMRGQTRLIVAAVYGLVVVMAQSIWIVSLGCSPGSGCL